MAYSASEFEYLIPWSTHVVAVELRVDAEVDEPTTLSKKSY